MIQSRETQSLMALSLRPAPGRSKSWSRAMNSAIQPPSRSPLNASYKATGCLLTLFTASALFAQAEVPAPPGPALADPSAAAQPDQDGVETLTRGPIHEAFANPAELDPAAAPIVAKQPPADVPEQPP